MLNEEEILRLDGPPEDLRSLYRVVYDSTGLVIEEHYVYTPDQCVEGDEQGWTAYCLSETDRSRQFTGAGAKEYLQENLK